PEWSPRRRHRVLRAAARPPVDGLRADGGALLPAVLRPPRRTAGGARRAGALRPAAPPAAPPPAVDAHRAPAPAGPARTRADTDHGRERVHGERASEPRQHVARGCHRRLLRRAVRLDIDRLLDRAPRLPDARPAR